MEKTFTMPEKIHSGIGALQDSISDIVTLGKKALIVTSVGTWKRSGSILDTLLQRVGIAYTVYDGINSEPTDTMITKGVAIYRNNHCDFLIAIGGGSTLDAMKAIAAMLTNAGNIADYMGKTITTPVPPMVAIPTTAGTGSEATSITIITDTKKDIKMLLKGDVLMPTIAIIDPSFTVSSPKSVTAATGLDALTHAIEAYTSKIAQPRTDALAISAVKRIFKYLPLAYRDGGNIEARSEMATAAFEAGMCINNASVTLVHGMSRPIGALFHVPHGLSNAMLLKECFAFALEGAYPHFATLGREIGAASPDSDDIVAANALLQAICEICTICEVPTLKAYGIEQDAFFSAIDKMAEDAIASGSPNQTRRPVTKQDCIDIYHKLWR